MKKKKLSNICVFGIMILILIVIFVYSVSAVYIAGNNFNIVRIYSQDITTNYTTNYSYIMYSTDSMITLSGNDSGWKDVGFKAIINYLSVDVLTDIYNNTAYQTLRDKWLSGYYFSPDTVGPVQQRIYIQDFNTYFNELISKHATRYMSTLNGIANTTNLKMQSLIRWNSNFKLIYLENLEGFLNDLSNNALIPTLNYHDLIYNSGLNGDVQETISTQDENIFNGIGLYTDKNSIYKIVYPISTYFTLENSLNYIQDRNTWNFIPVQIVEIVLQFIIYMVSIGLMFKLFKTLRG